MSIKSIPTSSSIKGMDASIISSRASASVGGTEGEHKLQSKKRSYNPFKSIVRRLSSSQTKHSSSLSTQFSDESFSKQPSMDKSAIATASASASGVDQINQLNNKNDGNSLNKLNISSNAIHGSSTSIAASASTAATDDKDQASNTATTPSTAHSANMIPQIVNELRAMQKRELAHRRKMTEILDKMDTNIESIHRTIGYDSLSFESARSNVRMALFLCFFTLMFTLLGVALGMETIKSSSNSNQQQIDADNQKYLQSRFAMPLMNVSAPLLFSIICLPIIYQFFRSSLEVGAKASESGFADVKSILKECKTLAISSVFDVEDGEERAGGHPGMGPNTMAFLLSSSVAKVHNEDQSNIPSATPLRDRIKGIHMPSLPASSLAAVGARLRGGSMKRHGSARGRAVKSQINEPNEIYHKYQRPEGEPPSDPWARYCYDFLPLEQTYEFSQDEEAFAQRLRDETKDDKDGGWDAMPRNHQLMVLRGYAEKKDRFLLSIQGIRHINDWRKRFECDVLTKKLLPGDETYYDSWQSYLGGLDEHGHPLVFERIEELNIERLLDIEEVQFFKYRTQHLEIVQQIMHDLSQKRGYRVSKYIYVLDLKGLSPSKHFTQRVKNILLPIFKVSGETYPDCLWSLWLINSPWSFRIIWAVIARELHTSFFSFLSFSLFKVFN